MHHTSISRFANKKGSHCSPAAADAKRARAHDDERLQKRRLFELENEVGHSKAAYHQQPQTHLSRLLP